MDFIVTAIFIILIHYVPCAFFSQALATAKGYDEKYFFYIGLFFGIVGLLFVVGLPNKNKSL